MCSRRRISVAVGDWLYRRPGRRGNHSGLSELITDQNFAYFYSIFVALPSPLRTSTLLSAPILTRIHPSFILPSPGSSPRRCGCTHTSRLCSRPPVALARLRSRRCEIPSFSLFFLRGIPIGSIIACPDLTRFGHSFSCLYPAGSINFWKQTTERRGPVRFRAFFITSVASSYRSNQYLILTTRTTSMSVSFFLRLASLTVGRARAHKRGDGRRGSAPCNLLRGNPTPRGQTQSELSPGRSDHGTHVTSICAHFHSLYSYRLVPTLQPPSGIANTICPQLRRVVDNRMSTPCHARFPARGDSIARPPSFIACPTGVMSCTSDGTAGTVDVPCSPPLLP